LAVDLAAVGIEDRRLHRPVQELVRMAAEELVERVLTGHIHGQPATAAACSSPHLTEAGHGPGEGDADGGIQLPNVDAQLQCVGGHDPEQVRLGAASWSPKRRRPSPVGPPASSTGLAIVALARTNLGLVPWMAATRRRRRKTFPTWDPNTPRYVWASSTTTKARLENSS